MAEKNMNNEKATPSTSLEQPIIYLLDTNTLLIVKRSSSQRVSPKSLLLNSEKEMVIWLVEITASLILMYSQNENLNDYRNDLIEGSSMQLKSIPIFLVSLKNY